MADVSAIKLPNGSTYNIKDSSKQPLLESGVNIKTINNQSILGSGNMEIKEENHIELTQAEYDELTQEEKENGEVYFITDGTPEYTIINDSVPIGAIQAYGGASLPYGWLFCDGSAVSRETYSELFSAIGVAYGEGDGSTTFNLPDLRGRVLIGQDLTYLIGDKGGEINHTLDTSEMPNHSHDVRMYYNQSGHGTDVGHWQGYVNTWTSPLGGTNGTTTLTDINTWKVGFTSGVGSSQAHNNMQPYLVGNYIIKALNTVNTGRLEELDPQHVLFDILYPVGSYYETSDIMFDPNEQWTGTWISENKTDDYIIDEGHTGIWMYRKWNSGIAECWGVQVASQEMTSTYGSDFYKNSSVTLPNNLFVEINNAQVTRGADGEGTGLVAASIYNTTLTTLSYYVWNSTSLTRNIGLSFNVKGLWRNYITPESKIVWHRSA